MHFDSLSLNLWDLRVVVALVVYFVCDYLANGEILPRSCQNKQTSGIFYTAIIRHGRIQVICQVEFS